MSPTDNLHPHARIHVIVEGRVQGVGFRTFVLFHAESLNITGWVRNLINGNLEVLAEGIRQNLEVLCDHIEKGPRGSFVTDIHKQWEPASGEFASFEIHRTE